MNEKLTSHNECESGLKNKRRKSDPLFYRWPDVKKKMHALFHSVYDIQIIISYVQSTV